MFSYFFPLFGAAISDSFLTKFKTITGGSVIYLAGIILMAISSVPTIMNSGMAIGGLMMIALGAGAIKPCVSSHGGDQFLPEQKVSAWCPVRPKFAVRSSRSRTRATLRSSATPPSPFSTLTPPF